MPEETQEQTAVMDECEKRAHEVFNDEWVREKVEALRRLEAKYSKIEETTDAE